MPPNIEYGSFGQTAMQWESLSMLGKASATVNDYSNRIPRVIIISSPDGLHTHISHTPLENLGGQSAHNDGTKTLIINDPSKITELAILTDNTYKIWLPVNPDPNYMHPIDISAVKPAYLMHVKFRPDAKLTTLRITHE